MCSVNQTFLCSEIPQCKIYIWMWINNNNNIKNIFNYLY